MATKDQNAQQEAPKRKGRVSNLTQGHSTKSNAIKPKETVGGRPSKYDPEFHPHSVYQLGLLGADIDEMVRFYGISRETFYQWIAAHKPFSDALSNGKEIADMKVAHALYSRATGYEHNEDKIFCNKDGVVTVVPTTKHIPPDTTSMIFWLKNRQPKKWRDKTDVDLNANIKAEVSTLSDLIDEMGDDDDDVYSDEAYSHNPDDVDN